jgi:AcrR family transcriptional regulator
VSAPSNNTGRSTRKAGSSGSKRSSARYARLPVEDPLSSIPPTAQRILAASRRILATDGLRALTVDAIVEEAQVNRSAIRYYFGSKAGMLAAVVDSLIHDTTVALLEQTSTLGSGEKRTEVFISGVEQIATDAEAYAVFFNVLCEAIRDDELRERVAELYEFWREENLRWVGADGAASSNDDAALATLLVAIADGLAVQHFVGRNAADTKRALALFSRMLQPVLEERSRLTTEAT